MGAARGTPADRLARRLAVMDSGCIEWTGATNKMGYGIIGVNGKTTLAHRLAWTLANGPIPDGLQVLHHCDNPPCCNVEKCLFLGTPADNASDRDTKGRCASGRTEAAKTHCPQDHEYTAANTYVDKRGGRSCKTCGLARNRLRRSRVDGQVAS